MKEGPDISAIAALIGDPARANILTALMSGKALTASELAAEAGVTLPTASAHLSKLAGGALIAARKQGRHKYFTIASDQVADLLEALMGLAAGTGLHAMTRHMLGLFNGQPGARRWRRTLSEKAVRKGAGLEVLDEALSAVLLDA